MICFYHRVDFDGICSAAIFRKKFGDKCLYYGINYGDEFPLELALKNSDEGIYFVDFSLKDVNYPPLKA